MNQMINYLTSLNLGWTGFGANSFSLQAPRGSTKEPPARSLPFPTKIGIGGLLTEWLTYFPQAFPKIFRRQWHDRFPIGRRLRNRNRVRGCWNCDQDRVEARHYRTDS